MPNPPALMPLLTACLACLASHATTNYVWAPLPIRTHAEFVAGLPGGEGEQHPKSIARCAAQPERVYLGIDVAGTWCSTNAGRSWVKNLDHGLLASYVQSIAVDPLNPDIVFALAAAPDGATAEHGGFSGLYRSLNGGSSWQRVSDVPVLYKHLNYLRINRNVIACRTPAPDAACASVWYTAIDEQGVFVSTNGGAAWFLYYNTITAKAYYAAVVQHENGADVLYVGSTDGLHRYAAVSGTVTRTDLQVPIMYVPPAQAGYEGGITTIGLERAGGTGSISRIWAARRFDRAYYTATAVPASSNDWCLADIYKETGALWITNANWSAAGPLQLLFIHPQDARKGVLITDSFCCYLAWESNVPRWVRVATPGGFITNLAPCYAKRVLGAHSGVAFAPANADDMVAYSSSTPWRSDDGGVVWRQSNAGYIGYAWTFGRNAAVFHRANSNQAMFLCNDVGPILTTTAWQWSWFGTNFPADLWHGSTAGDYDPDQRSNLVALMGIYSSGFKIVVSDDAGLTWRFPQGTNQAYNYRYARCVRFVTNDTVITPCLLSTNNARAFLPIDFSLAYPGRVAPPALNAGDYWFVADSAADAGWPILYALHAAGYKYIMRGEYLAGDYRWSLVYNKASYMFKVANGSFVFAVDPHRRTRVYGAVKMGTWLLRYDTDLGLTNNPADAHLELHDFTPYMAYQSASGGYNHITVVEPDPLRPDVLYVGTDAAGLPCVFRVVFNANKTISVADISGTLPQLGMSSLRVNPHTGQLYAGTHAGTYVLPATAIPEPAALAAAALILLREFTTCTHPR